MKPVGHGGNPPDVEKAFGMARLSLDGLRVGDAFGERHFFAGDVRERIRTRVLPAGSWGWTDDTAMAISVVETLKAHGRIDQDDLAARFGRRYLADPRRGYGGGASMLLQSVARGADWRSASRAMFFGSGSYGNGSAMRVAPLGAWFAGDLERAAEEAMLSAEVTHAHPEGIAGAMAVAVAAAFAAQSGAIPGRGAPLLDRGRMFEAVLDLTPASRTRERIQRALTMEASSPGEAAAVLGSGHEVATFDTVPFCLWVAARHADNYEDALWTAVQGFGDQDTVAAIVGGVVALSAPGGVPAEWLERTERLPEGALA